MTPPSGHVSVTLPVSQAIERVKRVLFQPFDLGKWITIGFCAWLARLGQGASSGYYNYNPDHHGSLKSLRGWMGQARDYVGHNLHWLLPLAAVLLLLGLVLWVLFIWLSSRGRFMFLHCVALDRAEVAIPWRKFDREANSLFRFRLVVGLIGLLAALPLLVVMAVVGWRMIERTEPNESALFALVMVGAALLLVLFGIVFWVVGWLTRGFVVPIMFRRGGGCLAGWRVLLRLLASNLGHFILYFLFQIILELAIGVVILTAVLATCCILGCALAIPFLGTVLMLPIHVFRRSYSLYYLAQYGEEYDVFCAVS
jgi:hypothetical protein